MKRKVFFSIIIVLIGIGCVYLAKRPHIEFVQKEIHLGLYDEVKPFEYIAEVNHMNIKEIK
ncbi:MAG: polysaccharide deacetylase, partial [Coprobacillus sp.]